MSRGALRGWLGRLASTVRSRPWLAIVVVDLVSSIVIATISLRVFLFGNGYYLYADRTWAPDNSVPPAGYFSTQVLNQGVPNAAQFTRDVVTFPWLLIGHAAGSPVAAEQWFIFWTFLVLLGALFLFAEILTRALERLYARKVPWLERQGFRTLVVVLGFSSPFVMNSNVDGGTITDSLAVVLTATVLVALTTWPDSRRTWLLGGIAGSLIVLVDPVAYPGFLVGILVVALIVGLIRARLRERLGVWVRILIVSVPAAILMAYALSSTLVPSGPFTGYRPLDLFTAQAYALNLSPLAALGSTGFYWSQMTFAPPSVALGSTTLSALPAVGYPAQMLLPSGLVSGIWIASLFLVPALAIASLLDRRVSSMALPAVALLIVGTILTQYPWIPGLDQAIVGSFALPGVGGALGTSFIFAERFEALIVAGLLVAAPIPIFRAVFSLRRGVSSPESAPTREESPIPIASGLPRPLRPYARRSRDWIHSHRRPVATALVCVLAAGIVLAGWQAFNGSYYPSRAQFPYVPGNSVPNSAPFDPVHDPGAVSAYAFLAAQPGTFDIYWPDSGTASGGFANSQHLFNPTNGPAPEAAVPALPYLLTQRWLGSVAPYLQSQDVGFLVVGPEPSTVNLANFGNPSIAATLQELNGTEGLAAPVDFGGFYVYAVASPLPQTYSADLLASFAGPSYEYGALYGLFDALGEHVAVAYNLSSAPALSIDDPTGALNLLDPAYLANSDPANRTVLTAGASPTPVVLGPHDQTQVENWTVLNGETVTGSIAPMTVRLAGTLIEANTSSPSALLVSYNGTLATPSGGIVVPAPPDERAVGTIAFNYTLPAGAVAGGGVSAQSWSVTGAHFGQLVDELPPGASSGHVVTNVSFPAGAARFTFRVSLPFNGTATLEDLTLGWSYLSVNRSGPMGPSVLAGSRARPLPPNSGIVASVCGNGTLNGRSVAAPCPDFDAFELPAASSLSSSGPLWVGGLVTLPPSTGAALATPSLVYCVAFQPGYEVTGGGRSVSAVAGIDDINVFPGANGTDFKVVYPPQVAIEAGFLGVIVYLFALPIVVWMRRPSTGPAERGAGRGDPRIQG